MFSPESHFGKIWNNFWGIEKQGNNLLSEEQLHFATVDFPNNRISDLISYLYKSRDFTDRFAAGALNGRFNELLQVADFGQLYPVRQAGHFTNNTSGFPPEEAERRSRAIRGLVGEQAIDGNIGVLTKLATIRLDQLVVEIAAKVSEIQVLTSTAGDKKSMALYSALKRDLWYLNDDSFSIGLVVDSLYPRIDPQAAHSLDPWQAFLNDPTRYTLRIPRVFEREFDGVNLDPSKTV